jgi:hypothetical protein
MGNIRTVNAESQVNENVVRLVAGFVLLSALVTIGTGWAIVPIYLSIDFFLRAFTSIKPPFALISKEIARALHLEIRPIYAPPKKFAAAIGFVFSVAISASLLSGFTTTAIAVACILAIFATLESVFAICAGCYVYSWVVAPLLEKFKFEKRN